jgi:hypothetical protein
MEQAQAFAPIQVADLDREDQAPLALAQRCHETTLRPDLSPFFHPAIGLGAAWALVDLEGGAAGWNLKPATPASHC